jgi:SRSO17 transposase
MLDAWGEQVPHGWVTADDELGRHTQFRGALRERGERYVLGMPCNTTMRDLEAPLPAYQGRGRRPKAPVAIGDSVAPIAPPDCVEAVNRTRRRERPGRD